MANALAGAAAVNLAIAAGVGWLLTLGRSGIPVWAAPVVGGPSVAVDTAATLFLLPCTTWLLVTAGVGRERRRGTLGTLAAPGGPGPDRLPRWLGRLLRADLGPVRLGATCLAALGPVTAAVLLAIGCQRFGDVTFVAYKAGFAVALGAAVTPLIALQAMVRQLAPEPPPA